MEGKKEHFFKRYEILFFLLLFGIVFFGVTKRWDLYEKPSRRIVYELQAFLGVEGTTSGNEESWTGKWPQNSDAQGKDVGEQEDDPLNGPGGDPEDPLGDGTGEGIGGDGVNGQGAEGQGTDGQSVTEVLWQTVDESYFDDALFIGDSRIVGLRDYGNLQEHATFYAYEGLNIFRILTAKYVEVPGQMKKISVEEALGQRQFGKIYLMTGINELDIGTTQRFAETYGEVISRIRELQPNAKIIIQSIMLVTQKRAEKGDFVTNRGIMERNQALQTLADGVTVFYLDVNEAVTDESGGMNPTYTTDGIHLKAKYVPLWTDFLKTHALP